MTEGCRATAACRTLSRKSYLSAAFDFFTEEGLAAFLHGFQEIHELGDGGVVGSEARAAACVTGAHRSLSGRTRSIAARIAGQLRTVGECQWKELFESVSIVHTSCARDPAGSVRADGLRQPRELSDGHARTGAEF